MGDFDPRRPFRAQTAVKHGISRARLRSADFKQLIRGCYIESGTCIDVVTRAQAAVLMVPGAVVSHHTAMTIWGVTVPAQRIHLTVPPRRRTTLPEVRLHRLKARPRYTTRHGLRITTPIQTFVDLGGYVDGAELVAIADRLLRLRLVTLAELRQAAGSARGQHSAAIREAAALAREGVDSMMESKLRMVIIGGGLPEPEVNHRIVREDGSVRRRIELVYADLKIAIEYDGRHHIDRQAQWQADILRREELEAEGWKFIVVTNEDLRDPEALLERIRRAIRERTRAA
ncbi:DUF559 domain-containing protein [Calidifontibacter sp. DB0510]|uniref:DUF559 domain-containing protein n=1 Tax=Metallococcus carri TaxID=1656884 RepID=A0A967EAA5_9MICO|nr:DUF559 domain-containing protein [Metallococcus carri]NHN57257.1 DUF559 domain-containing protein [Metallococcus carri]NOP37940.1 DUF559 domain-containing protein [Calidifontibacter sp. DB2511S]